MTTAAEQFVGATAFDVTGHKIGKIRQIFFDTHTREPKWISVHTGLFGFGSSVVPLAGAAWRPDTVTVVVDKATVKHAPRLRVRGDITVNEEHRLARYYQLSQSPEAVAPQPGQSTGRHSTGRHSIVVDAIAAAGGIGGTAVNTLAQHASEDPDQSAR